MISENTFNKSKLISELKEIHIELVEVYKKIFDFKYRTNEDFEALIDKEYKENKISSGEQQVWNDNFCHRASYTLLNKILFIRICEDKGFMLNPEDYVAGEPKDPHIGKKLSRIGLQKWANLVTNYTLGELVKLAFLDMKKSYGNIALYKDDKYEMLTPTTEELSLKYLDGDEEAQKLVLQFENALSNIVEKLDTNNYNFNNTDGNILGDVYEKFMDRETRKAIGQFYTPEFVIEYILNNTVAKADVVENPFLSIADISCGSGHFLIMAYDILREKFINNIELLRDKYANEVYTIKKNGKEEELKGRDYWKEENIHYHLLKHCIYGTDIDSFAVQLSTINLLLKDLDNFTDELNIFQCDSLIKWESDYEWEDLESQLKEDFEIVETVQMNLLGKTEKIITKQKKEHFTLKYRDLLGIERIEDISRERAEEIVNLCQLWNRKYYFIVGNPPYGSKINSSELKNYYMTKYDDVHMRTIDVYNYFISRAAKKVNNQLGYIIPSTLLAQYEYTKCRKYLIDNFSIQRIINLGENVFDDNSYPTMIIVFSGNKEDDTVRILDIKDSKSNEERREKINDSQLYEDINQAVFKNIDNYKLLLIDEKYINLMFKIKTKHKSLIDICEYVSVGIASGNDKAFIIKQEETDNIDEILLKKVLVGGDINRYSLNDTNKYILYIDRETNMEDCHKTIRHLEKYKVQLSSRREAKKGIMRWFELHWPRNAELFESKKIICRQTGDELIATVDDKKYYTLNSIIDIVLKKTVQSKFTEEYVCAILNSRLMNFYYKLLVQENDKLFAEVKPVVLKELPIPTADSITLEKVNKLVSEAIALNLVNKELYNKFIVDDGVINNYIENVDEIENNNYRVYEIDKELNDIVYRLFGINEESVKVIEDYYNRVHGNNLMTNKTLGVAEFIDAHINKNLSLFEISKKYGVKYQEIIEIRKQYRSNGTNIVNELYNYESLYKSIDIYFSKLVYESLNSSETYLAIDECVIFLEQKVTNFDEYLNVLRNRTIKNRKKAEIIKDCLSKDTYTWNAYSKARFEEKINKNFVRYYDKDYYGLAEWSDEIHKNYFLDAIEEYTVNNPNEKKAKDILKLFKDLDIEDKEDYIEVIEEKIRKTFK